MMFVNLRKFALAVIFTLFINLGGTSIGYSQKDKIGISIGLNVLSPKKLQQISAADIDYVETSLATYINKDSLTFTLPQAEIERNLQAIKQAADEADIVIWSIHMPYGKEIDISFVDEDRRQKVIAFHKQVLKLVKILKPSIILFHPSYYLDLNERQLRISQLLKSVNELNTEVKKIKASMVVENMLGPALLVNNGEKERPLMRTVEESLAIFKQLPSDVYAAVDLNHISKPQELLLALGKRVKTLHVADGDGKAERHYFPCDAKGENNWEAIFAALTEINYRGPFMYESTTKDLKDYKGCYDKLRSQSK